MTVFDDGKRPNLVVGESLVPAVIPVLKKLGLEEKVAGIGMYKLGVSFYHAGPGTGEFRFPQRRALRPANVRLKRAASGFRPAAR